MVPKGRVIGSRLCTELKADRTPLSRLVPGAAPPADPLRARRRGLRIAPETATGLILNCVGYRVSFFIGCGFALIRALVTLRMDPVRPRSAARQALDDAQRGV